MAYIRLESIQNAMDNIQVEAYVQERYGISLAALADLHAGVGKVLSTSLVAECFYFGPRQDSLLELLLRNAMVAICPRGG